MEMTINGMRESYSDILYHVLEYGVESDPRGQPTFEVENFQLVLLNPERCLPTGTGRNLNKAIGFVEALSLIGGESYPQLLNRVSNGQFTRFMDGEVLHGAYGPRIRPQMRNLLTRLGAHETRQAVLTIWDPAVDNTADVRKDLPCTIALQYLVRDGKLNATTYMRSNDAWLGLPYDVFQFTQLQWSIANALGLVAGTYRHVVGSLHIYQEHWYAAERVHPAPESDLAEYYGVMQPHGYLPDWDALVNQANATLRGTNYTHNGCALITETRDLLHPRG